MYSRYTPIRQLSSVSLADINDVYTLDLPVCFIQHQPFDFAQTKTVRILDVV